ncbi:Uncharacterized protein FWK35_00029950, partial [Aphis craccivora]
MMSTKQPSKFRKIRQYKRWVIVMFTETNDYSVVPVNWLILPTMLELTASNISVIEYCRWPPFNVTSIELQNADDPEDSWDSFKIKVLATNFKEAWHQRVEIESSATENECETTKKKKKNHQRSSSDDSDFEDCSLSITPISKKLKKDVPFTFTELLVRGSNEELDCSLASVTSPAVQIVASSSASSYIQNKDNEVIEDIQKQATPQVQNNQMDLYNSYEPFILTNNSSYSTTESSNTNQKILNILTNMELEQVNIKRELVASNLILNRLLTKVEVLETNSKNNHLNSTMANQYIDSNFLSLFPIKDKDAFLSVELNIVNEVDFVLKLESFIKSIGGCGSKNNITRVLQKLFSDEFAVISTWTGRGKNISIAIGSSEMIKLIKRIIKANSNGILTDSEFEITNYNSKKKNIALISTKYFKRILKDEQQKVNLSDMSIVNNSSVNCVKKSINNDIPLKLSLSLKDPSMPESSSLNTSLNTLSFETVQSNNCNLCVDDFYNTKKTDYDTLNPLLEVDVPNKLSITEKLRLLIVKHKVSHNFCNGLLHLLKSEGLDVPKDIRTLMKTPKLHDIVDISGGSYIHLGLRNMLLPILIKNNAQI